ELSNLRRNRCLGFVFPGEHIRSLQPVSRDTQHGCLAGMNTPLPIQFVSSTHGHSTGSLGEYAFGFCQELDGFHQLWIRNILCPAPALRDGLDRVMTI